MRSAANRLLAPTGYQLAKKKKLADFYLHEYGSYEEYRDIQIHYNKRKLNQVWADEATLDAVIGVLKDTFGERPLRGLCHGARNGFEQAYLRKTAGYDATGTDISDTATQFEHSVVWDFHDVNPDWVGAFDFVYSNSLDQSWKPRGALVTWLNQLKDDGLLLIEHTEAHGPVGASAMDPFGVRPVAMPYVLAQWFGHDISIRFVTCRKRNRDMEAWLFIVRKRVPTIA
ncbi:MAG: hypothetical protein H6843_07310 [Rhodospirillaceae bacterium]|nr:hypothetical protein [Rhodospirillaceae bacterium]